MHRVGVSVSPNPSKCFIRAVLASVLKLCSFRLGGSSCNGRHCSSQKEASQLAPLLPETTVLPSHCCESDPSHCWACTSQRAALQIRKQCMKKEWGQTASQRPRALIQRRRVGIRNTSYLSASICASKSSQELFWGRNYTTRVLLKLLPNYFFFKVFQ